MESIYHDVPLLCHHPQCHLSYFLLTKSSISQRNGAGLNAQGALVTGAQAFVTHIIIDSAFVACTKGPFRYKPHGRSEYAVLVGTVRGVIEAKQTAPEKRCLSHITTTSYTLFLTPCNEMDLYATHSCARRSVSLPSVNAPLLRNKKYEKKYNQSEQFTILNLFKIHSM